MPELIENGKTGLLVEDFVEGYHQMEECFAMDREYIATRSQKLFNYQVMTKQYLRAYKKVLRIFKIREREDRKIKQITSKTKRELETIWERDAQGRIIPKGAEAVTGELKRRIQKVVDKRKI